MISANNITLRVGKKALFEDVNIKFTEGNCYGLIGANGAGKSTFLKILSGQLEPTKGDIVITPGQRLSFLQQDHFKYDAYTVLDTVIMGNLRLYEIMKEKEAIYAKEDFTDEDGIRASELEGEFAEMNGWEAESDAATLLNGLGIDTEFHYAQMADLTGSMKVKVLLAQALFGNPDILLLDEPTNHLDLPAIEWLEEFLINFDNTVIVVSHDRYFLNKVCTQTADIDYGKITLFAGNYDFWRQSSELIQKQMKESNKKKEDKIKIDPKIYNSTSIGSDEVGTGDYFGPIVVTATYVKKEDIPYLESLGIKDSKKLTDEKILQIVPIIKDKIKYSTVILSNREYNLKYKDGYNMNKLKAILHNKVLSNLKNEGLKYDYIVVDQFAEKYVYFSYLKESNNVVRDITFLTKGEDKCLAVACASIISRYIFIKEFAKIESEVGLLPKGASSKVDECAKKIVDKYGFDKLNEIAKLNFKNTEKIKNL